MKKANIVLDNKSSGLSIIEKMDFENVDMVQDVLFCAFHPDELGEDDQLDDRYMALWHIFLVSVGWTDNEYWEEFKSRPRKCPGCGEMMDKDGNHVDDDSDVKSPNSKPN